MYLCCIKLLISLTFYYLLVAGNFCGLILMESQGKSTELIFVVLYFMIAT